jgi:hypothetical protein
MPGLDPGIHAVTSQRIWAPMVWIAGSSPAMTKEDREETTTMVNIYLFIELLHSANAMATLDTIKALELANCKFANVVMLSDEKLVAQLDCKDSTDGDKAILNKIAKVEGVVQTNIVAVVRPTKG